MIYNIITGISTNAFKIYIYKIRTGLNSSIISEPCKCIEGFPFYFFLKLKAKIKLIRFWIQSVYQTRYMGKAVQVPTITSMYQIAVVGLGMVIRDRDAGHARVMRNRWRHFVTSFLTSDPVPGQQVPNTHSQRLSQSLDFNQ